MAGLKCENKNTYFTGFDDIGWKSASQTVNHSIGCKFQNMYIFIICESQIINYCSKAGHNLCSGLRTYELNQCAGTGKGTTVFVPGLAT